MSDEERNSRDGYDEDEDEDKDIKESTIKNISTIFKKLKEEIEIAMESKENQKQKISEILYDVQIPYSNQTCPNYFYDILEMLRKKKCLDTFVNFVRVKNNSKLQYTVKEAYLKELNVLSGIKDENASLNMMKYIVGNFIFQLNKRDQRKLEHFLIEKNKYNPNYFDKIVAMPEKTQNIFTLNICGLSLCIKSDKKKKLEEIFVNFLVDKIIDDEDKENNIAKLRILSPFLNNISSELFFDKIIGNCGRLLSRSSKNYEFLSTVFNATDKINYSDDFIKNVLFNEYKSFFFPTSFTSPKRTKEISQSFKNIAENCNLSVLLQVILDLSLDQNDLYTYSYNFISRVIKIYATNKEINKKYPLNEDLLIQCLLYVIDNFDKIYYDSPEQKLFINYFFQTFLSSLYCLPKIKIDQSKNKDNISKIGSGTKDLINNNQYSNYHNYLYLIPAVTMEQFDFVYEDEISDLFYSLLEDNCDAEITEENSMNILPLATCALNLSAKDSSFKQKSEDKLNKVFTNMVTSNLIINNYNKLSQIESISLYLISQFLAKGQSSFTEDEVNHTNFLKLLSKALFKGKTSNNELDVFNQLVLILVEYKEVSIQLLNLLFDFILHLDNQNKSISFRRVAIFLDKFVEKYFVKEFIEEMDKSIYLKLIILIHIPNMHLDININNHKSHHNNMFIQKYYRDENKKNLMISSIEENIVDTICPFVFSRFGLFNKSNIIIVNACYSLITKIFQETKVSNLLLENSFGMLKPEKFKEAGDKLEQYKKDVDYKTKYE